MSRQKIRKFLFLVNLLVIGLFLFQFVQAVSIHDPMGGKDVPEIAVSVIKYILGIVGVLALVMFIYGGIMWMTSAGAPEKIETGKKTIVWAILGLALIFCSHAILNFVLKAFIK